MKLEYRYRIFLYPSLSTLQKIITTLSISLPMLFFLAADSDGLEKIDSNLAQRLAANAFEIVRSF